MKEKNGILLAAVMVSMLITAGGVQAKDVSTYSELQAAIEAGTTPINLKNNISATGSPGTLGCSVVINGNENNITTSGAGSV